MKVLTKQFALNLCVLFSVICQFNGILCFHVNFRENYNVRVESFNTQIHKREMTQFFDRASYTFNGFEKIESIPVPFPIDVCILNVTPNKYAACLHKNPKGLKQFSLYKMQNDTYNLITELATPLATAMDCKSVGPRGYIALAYNITDTIENAQEGSPIFELNGDSLRPVQYFPNPNLVSVYLRVTGNDLFLLQTFANTKSSPNLHCPYFRWSGSTFNRWGRIPCSNARHLEPFSIDYEAYVAVANYANQRGRTSTYSEIYKYAPDKKRFQLFQKIRTNGAVDVKYFSVPYDEVSRKHFLVFGNSVESEASNRAGQLDGDAIFYLYDKGQFVPYQRLALYKVEQFLPVQNIESEKFLLLVACQNQDIKIYNLNDWKFEESKAQFTAGALSKGVAKMRIHLENDNSYLVIANELMMANETNVFLPIFKQDEHANALRQEIIEWAKAQIERLSGLDIAKLQQEVEQKLSKFQQLKKVALPETIPSANVETVVTKSLIYPRLHMTTNYWKSLSFAKQALDSLESRPTSKRSKRELAVGHNEFEDIEVGTLYVRNRLQANWVNGVDASVLNFAEINATKIIVTRDFSSSAEELVGDANNNDDILAVKDLQIKGKLNKLPWSKLLNNTLKRQADVQFLKAPVAFDNLKAAAILVSSGTMNTWDLRKLIPTRGNGSFVINQDIQFAEAVQANRVLINERLNNIHVYQGKLDVLLKHSNETQLVEGPKRIDDLRILEPITAAGELLGKHLRDMAPNKAIHEPLTLNGDFTIGGNVTIGKLLQADTDIFIQNATVAVKSLLGNALNMQKPVENVNLVFSEPLDVNNSLVSFVNTQDVQHLVATQTDDVVVIEGKKVFESDLEIRWGFSEVKLLNGHDVEELPQRLFLRNTNETVKVPMHFGTIIAKGVNSSTLTLAGKNLTDFLTFSGNQHINGSLKTASLRADHLRVEQLNSDGPIFERSINEIYQQKARNSPQPQVFQKDRKFHGTVHIKNLYTNATINGRAVGQFEQQFGHLEGNVKYVGNFKFNYDMLIGNLTFHGDFNGVPANEWGSNWLRRQHENVQIFTKPQVMATLKTQQGLRIDGKLNGLRVEDLIHQTYWINRNEHIRNGVFESPIEIQGFLATNTLSGLQVPHDILYKSSTAPQKIHHEAFVNANVNVRGVLNVSGQLNEMNLPDLLAYLDGERHRETLHVEHANFSGGPVVYETLNQHDLLATLDAVWMANENVILHNHHVDIDEANVEGLITFDGHVNTLDMAFVRQHYFSLSRPQEIPTQHIFMQRTIIEGDLHAEELRAVGPIVVGVATNATATKGSSLLNFNEFVANTLKTSGPHVISSRWNLSTAIINGDFYGHVNDLNFVEDVLLHHSTTPAVITAPKLINSATKIVKLHATPESHINGVPMAHWIRNTVYAYENYTIRGNTTLDIVNVYNDLRVQGLVDGKKFDEASLLLKQNDQILSKDIHIRNKFDEDQRILANNFVNLHLQSINDRNFAEFLENLGKSETSMEIESNLIFNEPVMAQQYQSRIGERPETKWKRNLSNDTERNGKSLQETLEILEDITDALPHYELDHFEVRQILDINATKIIPLTLRIDSVLKDYICCVVDDRLQFYKWTEDHLGFVEDQNLSWLHPEKSLLEIIKLIFDNADYLTIENPTNGSLFHANVLIHRETNVPSSSSTQLNELLHLKEEENCQIIGLHREHEDCFALYGCSSLAETPIHCLVVDAEKSLMHVYQKDVIKISGVKQILDLIYGGLALLLEDAVEIWHGSPLQLKQRFSLVQPTHMAFARMDNGNGGYLAVASKGETRSLHHGAIDIYRSLNSSSSYVHMQKLDVAEPKMVAFMPLSTNSSGPLLLYVLTDTKEQPLMIYQYNGIEGFIEEVTASTLSLAQRMEVIQLKTARRHLVALMDGQRGTTFVEVITRIL